MASSNIFTTIRTEGALLPADLLQRISEGTNLDGLTPESYHRPGEKLNEVINRSWNALQGAWASFRTAQENLPPEDRGTTITRERWLFPLFRELDYGRLQTHPTAEIDGRRYPISHGWGAAPIHLVSYQLDLDDRTPGVAGAARATPHSLMQVYLNRSDEHLWGFLSNGYKLRILRDNVALTRQAYVEFDLEAMMDGEVYSDFVLLWLLCHQSRVEGERPSDCWLEKWMKVAEDQGTRAREQLRVGVEEAITALGLGFIEHPANHQLRDRLQSDGADKLDKMDYYRQLLRMVYRLLFLFAAEDRDLLLDPQAAQEARERYIKYYSTQRLRRVAEKFKGTRHPDLFEGLRLVMRLLSGDALTQPPSPALPPNGEGSRQVSPHEGESLRVGAASLALVGLGSFLFSDRAVADVIDCQIANSHLLDAIRALSLTYDQRAQVYRSVDYKNLGADEYGSVFESLLELHPQINIPARRFELDTAAGNERKTTGSYYTPDSLVQALLDSALDPVLEEAIKGPHPKSLSQGERDLRTRSEGDFLRRGTKDAEQYEKIASTAMVEISRNLRQRQTSAEEVMWEALRDRRLNNLKFRRQHPIAETSYVVDFLCYEARLVVELDGDIHLGQQEADTERQSAIEGLGYRVIRFANEEVQNDLQWVLARIAHAAALPSPPGRRAGDEGLTPEQRILALKVCDPACGSGHFLIAAANRMAKALATVRTGEEEPPPAAIQEAKRLVIGHCIYGVDINPMAVELCKVNLWMEALEPGKPLSFLDHRIQCGNSLLGTTPRLMANGIPDDAFNPIEGDDKADAAWLKKLNRQERHDRETGQRSLFEQVEPPANYRALSSALRQLDSIDDDTLAGLHRKEQAYAELDQNPERQKAQILADAWCAAFVWDKGASNGVPPLTDLQYRNLERDPLAERYEATRRYVQTLQQRYQFFHWHVAFPDVFAVPDTLDDAENEQTGWNGGFDCVLGNPPWERIKIQEKEWFAERAPEIANAPNAAARRRAIAELAERAPYLLQAFNDDKRKAEGESHFVRVSDRYPLCGRGDVNTYTIFAETSRHVINGYGRVGMIVPSGIATDDTTKFFFQDLMRTRSLASLYDFENRNGIFPGVHRSYKFSLVTMTGWGAIAPQAEFVFFALNIGDLQDNWRRFTLTSEDIAMLNPNTGTMATFRSQRDAEVTKAIYQHIPVLIQEEPRANPWGIRFDAMFHMSLDSDLFQNEYRRGLLPLYEAKLLHQFDHRYSTYKSQTETRYLTLTEKNDPNYSITPRYWISETEVFSRIDSKWSRKWMVPYRRIARTTDERTVIVSLAPTVAAADPAMVLMPQGYTADMVCGLISNLNSFVLDYVARQKIGGTDLRNHFFQQFPIIAPHTLTSTLLDFIVPRVLELSYTSWDLQPFAQDVGYQGSPFMWEDERRFLMRCELDALYFHLYQISHDDVDHIMDTFPIVKRKDETSHGEYLTRRVILEMYDQMTALPKISVPAPKDEHTSYVAPDLRQWSTWLSPAPADLSIAHS
ncbi:MAG: DUF559 domain-containing protein [Anaerolineae bacterium]|nr:DUF559 domain-containing protein [Anaerolineae bacterium]